MSLARDARGASQRRAPRVFDGARATGTSKAIVSDGGRGRGPARGAGGAGPRAMRARALESARAVLRRGRELCARARAMADESDLVAFGACARASERDAGDAGGREGDLKD